jgi:hypothetical protein
LVDDRVFFAVGFRRAVGALALGVACAFETGSLAGAGIAGAGATGVSAGVDCAGEPGVENHNTAVNATSVDRRIGGGEDKRAIVTLYADLDASERRGESLA